MGETRTEVVHCRRSRGWAYIGRGPGGRHVGNTPIGARGWLGNPFSVTDESQRSESIAAFRAAFLARLDTDPAFRATVQQLRGKKLGCWCAPRPCHGDVIAEWLDGDQVRNGQEP